MISLIKWMLENAISIVMTLVIAIGIGSCGMQELCKTWKWDWCPKAEEKKDAGDNV